MKFIIEMPVKRRMEATWALTILLDNHLGQAFSVRNSSTATPVITAGNKRLVLSHAFFEMADEAWLRKDSLPEMPLANWTPADANLNPVLTMAHVPILFGNGGFRINEKGDSQLDLDVVGAAFFMLSRYEELVIAQRDEFDRFPSTHGVFGHTDLAGRPIVDEYAEILWAAIQHTWPNTIRPDRRPRTSLSCDVDAPLQDAVFSRRKYESLKIRSRLSLGAARAVRNSCLKTVVESRAGNWAGDPFNTFDEMMDLAEKNSLSVEFYFLASSRKHWKYGWYTLDHPFIKDLLYKISSRGHRIGLHGSFGTYTDKEEMIRQREALETACQELGIDQEITSNRQHYLQFDARRSPQVLENANLLADASGGFADRPGFRFGTCRSFKMWNWENNTESKVVQNPLILMECSVLSSKYMGLDHSEETLNLMLDYQRKCHTMRGNFSVLWHNSNLLTVADWKTLRTLVMQQ